MLADPGKIGDPQLAARSSLPETLGSSLGPLRNDRLQTLFRALDREGTGHLKCSSMYVFAKKQGFPDSEGEFVEEYQTLCQEIKCAAEIGLLGYLLGIHDC